jgi:hypothetical protein
MRKGSILGWLAGALVVAACSAAVFAATAVAAGPSNDNFSSA